MKNMSRFSKCLILAAGLLVAASCGRTAGIEALVEDAASSEIIVKLLDVNSFSVLDTVVVDASGNFSCKVDVKKGQPEFVYLFHGDRKIVSLILQAGDKVSVVADTLGNYTVEGSEESARLSQVEKEYARVAAKLNALARRVEEAVNPQYAEQLSRELGKEYVSYYRNCVRYVMDNSRSLSVVPVFYQTFGDGFPVFGQQTDALHFKNAADSLSLVYPESRYVKALRKEADRRLGYLELQSRLDAAEPVSYPEIELPDLQGQKRKLSEVDAKVVMLEFWTATDAAQKMFNLDVLKPIYEDFHDKGFEIYQVSLDPDKGLWAQVVKQQELPWVSVCDSRGTASPYCAVYNLMTFPSIFIIADGELVDGSVVDEKSLRRLLKKLL